MNQRAMSLRMPESLAVRLGAIARTDGVPISEFVREANRELRRATGEPAYEQGPAPVDAS
jgi:hypothetical protein